MDVKTVCLGMLTDGEASGYDLKKHFESTFSHFFAAGYGSIYPALSSLLSDGLVECTEIPQDGKPDRKVYRITDAGVTHLKEELDNPDASHKVRSEFLATMCFAHLMTRDQVVALLDHRLAELNDYLALFDQLEHSAGCQWPAGKRFVCGFGRALTEATKIFIEENRELAVDEFEDQRAATG